MRRMSPTPLDRSVSPMRSVSVSAPTTPTELTTIEKLQARVWLMEEELGFASKVQTRSEVEAREWSTKLTAMRSKLQQAMAEHAKWTEKKMVLAQPPPLSDKERDQQQLLEKLKRHIAALGEKRQETLEETEAVKEVIARHKSENALEQGSREQLLLEHTELADKLATVTEARQKQQAAFDEYEATREELMHREVARIEQHVMGKLEGITSRRQAQEKQIAQAQEQIEGLEGEVLTKERVHSVLQSQLVDMEDSIKRKITKKDDYVLATQGMIDNIQRTQVERAEAGPKLEALFAEAPEIETKLQAQVAAARKEGILCLEEKALLYEALGQPSQAMAVREKLELMRLKLDFCPQFITLQRQGETNVGL
eukprot:TRINITY_DN14198_c0_g1_i2.p1 TRINITY_DN14198_c0_g1~~TRINITY_DN14198_c0_g1_i2.p1  ORF type:complete len:368 (-),score=145.45 TRINITY_DN14198_c0_g1_i2:89-1192(-)